MVVSRVLLRTKAGQALVLLGLATSIMCLWTAHYEWGYHSSVPHVQFRIPRELRGQARDYVVVNALLEEIHGYNDDEEANDDSYKANSSPRGGVLEPCALYAIDSLVGRLAGLKDCVAPEELVINHPDVEVGGRVRPKNCTAKEKLAIVIPFRNRFTHLYILLNNLIPLLQRQLVDARLFVIEQAMATMFNRAALFNIGFLEALKFDDFDCFIFHDVDLIPLDDRNLYRCDDQPVHLAVAMDKYDYKLPYKTYVGGVVAFTRGQYLQINGNSNLYFGWGGEDDDLYERIANKNYEIARPYQDVGKYDMMRHLHDSGNEDNCNRRRLIKSARRRQDVEGLNSVSYSKNSVTVKSHVTWINVYIDLNRTIATAPDYVLQELALQHNAARGHGCNFSRDAPIHE
ncbi:hypothetical protein BsWGS_07844 [Bradybaena similaris]